MMRRGLLALLMAGTLLPALPARAATSVTMDPSATEITYGQAVTLSGITDPVLEGEVVSIVDADTSTELGQAQTDALGAYSVDIVPPASVTVKAVALPGDSAPVAIGVRPILTVSLGTVRLFDRATITGTIHPPLDAPITVQLLRGSSVAAEVVVTASGGAFQASLPVKKPGGHRARAHLAEASFLPVTATSSERKPRLPRLRRGSRGVYVLLLERRLAELRYRVPTPNRKFDDRTGDAVLAFRKVQGKKRARTVNKGVWKKLASPRLPRARFKGPRRHIEVDQTKQVLYVVKDGRITSIVHVSTGGRGVGTTYDGTWRVHRRLSGFSPGRLYMPSYFHGGRAIHGWPQVPPTAASHGCVRVPMWTARWLYRAAPVGRVIKIYHS